MRIPKLVKRIYEKTKNKYGMRISNTGYVFLRRKDNMEGDEHLFDITNEQVSIIDKIIKQKDSYHS